MAIKITGIDGVKEMLLTLGDEFPTAMRNTINDTARDVLKREEQEIPKVFDQPTRIIRTPFFVEKATKEKFNARVRLKDVYGSNALGAGSAVENTLEPHIPGFPPHRRFKGMERRLQDSGHMKSNQYLVPSRTMKLNKFGNITGATASKMLNDIGAFNGVSGFNSTTSAPKVKYMWGTVNSGGKTVSGIWLKSGLLSGAPGALQMVVVNKRPTYRKRFDFYVIGYDHATKVMPKHADAAIKFALARVR